MAIILAWAVPWGHRGENWCCLAGAGRKIQGSGHADPPWGANRSRALELEPHRVRTRRDRRAGSLEWVTLNRKSKPYRHPTLTERFGPVVLWRPK